MSPADTSNRQSGNSRPAPQASTIAEPSSTATPQPQYSQLAPSQSGSQPVPVGIARVQPSASASNSASPPAPGHVVLLANPDDVRNAEAAQQPNTSEASSSSGGRFRRLLHPKRSRPANGSNETPPKPPPQHVAQRPSLQAQGRGPSIGLRRLGPHIPPGTVAAVPFDNAAQAAFRPASPANGTTGRRRSSSDPERGNGLPHSSTIRQVRTNVPGMEGMPTLQEETTHGQGQPVLSGIQPLPPANHDDTVSQSDVMDFEGGLHPRPQTNDEFNADWVDVLDTIDPEVSTLNTLTNVQNSLFIPNLGRFLQRRAVYNLTPAPTRRKPVPVHTPPPPTEPTIEEEPKEGEASAESRPQLTHTSTITSVLSESRYAVLPPGKSLAGWSAEDKAEVNDHVRHMLHSRRNKMKRALKGFGQYVKKPLGFLVTLYATLITLFGLAWVLFLIGWINVGGKQLYLINIIDYTLVALFAIMGDGLAPFRTWDTYNMIYIVHYHRLTWKLRKKRALPKLENKNDLPDQREEEVGLEETKQGDYIILTEKQQASLEKHQNRFSRSHTFYKPHETETHFAYPIAYLIAVVILLDCHSLLQISLGSVTWGIDYRKRPFALTTVILCCSISCNVTAAILITVGDHKTRKKDVVERMDRQELTNEAIEKIEKDREKERQKEEKEAAGETGILDSIAESLAKTKEKKPRSSSSGSRPNLSSLLASKGSDKSRAKSPSIKSAPPVPEIPTSPSQPWLDEAGASRSSLDRSQFSSSPGSPVRRKPVAASNVSEGGTGVAHSQSN